MAIWSVGNLPTNWDGDWLAMSWAAGSFVPLQVKNGMIWFRTLDPDNNPELGDITALPRETYYILRQQNGMVYDLQTGFHYIVGDESDSYFQYVYDAGSPLTPEMESSQSTGTPYGDMGNITNGVWDPYPQSE